MRRVALLARALTVAGAVAAAAVPIAPSRVTAAPVAAGAASTVCTVTDDRLIGLSGLVVTGSGFVSISDSNFDKSRIRIWYLDRHCALERSVGYPTSAYDPEDAAMGRDGTLYVADIGDNDRSRRSIAVWRLRPGRSTPKIYRYAYPDGPHDAEAILLAADDSPIIVTKDPATAGIYVPTEPADPSGDPVPLRRAGSFTLTPTDTTSGVGVLGGFVVTGGANSPDRRQVALRSYNDAYEWSVPDGDVVKAITTTRPVITPLANETQGESIAYAPDGRSFYTISDAESTPLRDPILRYPSAITAAAGATGAGSGRGGATGPARGGGSVVGILAVASGIGLLLALIGVVGLVRYRRAARYTGPSGDPVR